jgi:CheY-like chemotaxis protein
MPAPLAEPEYERAAPAPGPATVAGGRVLLMDDDPGVREAGRAFLEHLGYSVVVAADGDEAVAALRAALAEGGRFRVAILDLKVPQGMGGQEAVVHLRALDPELVAIVTSGCCEEPAMLRPAAHAFQAALPKPWFPGDLRRVLARTLAAPPA